MTNDLAKTIAAACLEAIQARPDSPSVDELADVVRPYLAGDQRPEEKCPSCGGPANPTSAVWPLANDVEPTRGKWVAGNYLPDAPATTNAPSTQELPWNKLRDPITDGPEYASTRELYAAKLRDLIAFTESIEKEPGDLLCYVTVNCVNFECDWPYDAPTVPGSVCGNSGCTGTMLKCVSGRWLSCSECHGLVNIGGSRTFNTNRVPTPKTPEAGDGE